MQHFIPFFQGEKRSIAERLAKYFEYSGLESKIQYDEEEDIYIVSVPADKEKEAKKYYQAFYFVERERADKGENDLDTLSSASDSNEDTTPNNDEQSLEEINLPDLEDDVNKDNDEDEEKDEDKDKDKSAVESLDDIDSNLKDSSIRSLMSGQSTYVMKSEKYKDYTGTQYIFIILGLAGILFVIINILGILTFINGLFSNIIMGALFLFFVFVGISTGKKAKQLKPEIDEENQLTDKIKEWLHNTVTEEFLTSISDITISEELDYIKKTDIIRDMINSEFGEQNPDYLYRLIDEYFD